MTTPTFQLTTMRNVSIESLSFTLLGAINFGFGYPPTKQLMVLSASLLGSISLGFPMPWALQLGSLPGVNKSEFLWNFQFFYPSNGNIPGSPIPKHGQLLPRPL